MLSLRFPFSSFVAASATGFLLVASAAPRAAHAQTPIINFTGGSAAGAIDNNTFGFDFTVTGTQTITGLGFFDFGADGLINSHTVGLFDNSGTLLTSTLITNANSTAVASTSASGSYRYVAITPQMIAAGTYVLGATYVRDDADGFVIQSSANNTSGFAFGKARNVSNNGSGTTALVFPGNNASGLNAGAFGPMAFTTSAAAGAPEPSTLPFLGMGIISSMGTLGMARRRQQSRAAKQAA